MTSRVRFFLFVFQLLLSTVLHVGCAPKLPSTLPVTDVQRQNVLDRYQTFRARDCNDPLDADIAMNLQSFGTSLQADGFMQIQPPGQFRVTIIDQLGRPAVILIGSKDLLTLVNIAKGRALIETVSSLTRESDNPVDLATSEIVSLLTGRLAQPVSDLLDMRLDRETGTLYWLIFPSRNKNRHAALFNPETQSIIRHIITDQEGKIILDIMYRDKAGIKAECPLPEELTITGGSLGGGEITVRYERVTRPEMIRESTFEIDLPEHYIIERKE